MAKKTKKIKKVETKKIDLSDIISSDTILAKQTLSEEQQKAFDLIQNTKRNVFIQGSAGSGKSTFIMYMKEHLTKSMIVCSPTAIAAINVGGQTLHSFFKLPVSDFIDEEMLYKTDRRKIAEILLKTEVLVIDEISMVRPDILDAIDMICKRLRKNKAKAFGGLQVLLIGDLYQLPSIVKNQAQQLFLNEYGTSDPFFFDSYVYHEANFEKIEFTHIYRQTDDNLLENLTKLRKNEDLPNVIKYFNNCKINDKDMLDTAITITPYRNVADEINRSKLKALSGELKRYKANYNGSFVKSKNFPVQEYLELKPGALVIFCKNHQPEWINGSSGIVISMCDDFITVKLLSNGKTVFVEREEWENKEYEIIEEKVWDEELKANTVIKKTKEKITGTFRQFPLQLGWACTIHRAQGKTLDKVKIDIGRGAFAHGQLYVALSRTKSYKDMHIIRPLHIRDSIINDRILKFISN